LALEKQVNLLEEKLANLHKDNDRLANENNTKVQNLTKENEKLNHLIQSIKK